MQLNSKTVTGVLLTVLILGVLYWYLFQPFRLVPERTQLAPDNGLGVAPPRAGGALGNRLVRLCPEALCRCAPLDNLSNSDFHLVAPDHLLYKQPSIVQGRTDVVTVTPWLAPVIWEGTFNPLLLDSIYKLKNITIAATVFAVGKYIRFLKDFLVTAEKHFFTGFGVHIYVFTDRVDEVPHVQMAPGRQLMVISVPSSNRWQEISARRMELVRTLIEEKLRDHVDYIFCLDVDSQFHGRWGTESLGGLVAVIHPGYYRDDRSKFPYERRPESRAYVAPGEGDFYYCGGAFGGLLQEVHQLVKICHSNFLDDAKNNIEAAWQEESHLNRYMWINKPSKVLSPEYLWQDFKPINPEVRIIRFSGVTKNYAEIRPNA
ncbi:globoside alpha-1,3-N-acetylgalactosaminyltransferase 1-like [Betta splendens]|uniref:Globoside alpha-1,3-N-acetylgalactosaminyltransferase 1-like n=1 Tax=Betta splendens TaxID=158456 RepID=A0A6P7N7W7_BETSP|nr:globoside alpha-1,3-N-acetylgalactosaminyltransferase 1-like [Betta splendens]